MKPDPIDLLKKIHARPLDWLKPNPRNPQEHPPEQIAELKRRIRAFGVYRPFVARPDGTLLIGHAMRTACDELIDEGCDEVDPEGVPCVVYVGDDVDAVRLMLGDNTTADMAERQADRILDLVDELRDSDAGLEGTGLDEDRIDALRAEARPRMAAGDDEESDEPEFAHKCPKCGHTW